MMATAMQTGYELGVQIKEAREKKGLTQAQIERDLGWGRSCLSKYESGKDNIPDERKDQLFDYLGLGEKKIADFFGFKESKTPAPVEDESPSKYGPNKNHEGYHDPTMAAALRNANIKYTDHMPGEMWLHVRRCNYERLVYY